MSDLLGKGMFTWVIKDCEGGDIDAIVARAKEAQLTFLMPKIAHRSVEYTINSPYLAEFVEKCHVAGIKVIAWQYVYGTNPSAEAERAIVELAKYDYDGFVINAEVEYKNRPTQAKEYCRKLRAAFPDLFIGLSSFRFPDYHPEFPWNEFLQYVDVNMPQVYWEQADGTAASQLDRCIALFSDDKYIQCPIMPTGAAYTNAGWVAKPQDIVDFIERANELELDAISFWEWRYPRDRFPELWPPIAETQFGNYEEPEMPDMVWNGKYKLVFLGNMKIHSEANFTSSVPDYALIGEQYITSVKSDNGFYQISRGSIVGWVYGNPDYVTVTKYLEPVVVDPAPEPEPEPSDAEKLRLLWEAHPELH